MDYGHGVTSIEKPQYPMIYRFPTFTQVVSNFSLNDYLAMTTLTSLCVPVGYLSGNYCNIRGPSMVAAGLIGISGGFMLAYQRSIGRLLGFMPNEEDVAYYRKKNRTV